MYVYGASKVSRFSMNIVESDEHGEQGNATATYDLGVMILYL